MSGRARGGGARKPLASALRAPARPTTTPHTEFSTLSARTTRQSLNPGFAGPSPCHSRDCLLKKQCCAPKMHQEQSPPEVGPNRRTTPSRARFLGQFGKVCMVAEGLAHPKNRPRRGPPTMVAEVVRWPSSIVQSFGNAGKHPRPGPRYTFRRWTPLFRANTATV